MTGPTGMDRVWTACNPGCQAGRGDQLAMVADGENNHCYFCGLCATVEEMVVHAYLLSPSDSGSHVGACSQCGEYTLIHHVRLAGESEPVSFCFGCSSCFPARTSTTKASAVPRPGP
ncbi:hypothetical protein GCM10010358_69950 [Streptomyces minutiscleroticus]|uniref:Uncharacterized protein n=1 Tax=Streptomyces minutiscleroticus TaxID=68238 RepID=A0A918U7X3_9ACTN|nr:hypothetical protein GCM10010358_69950 [Streptomyces minutiscleroticus]